MNERIKELADQCYHQYSEHNIDLEKFAELIIKECAEVAYDADADHGDAILEHFDLPYISE